MGPGGLLFWGCPPSSPKLLCRAKFGIQFRDRPTPMPETDLGECPAPNPLSRPGRDRAMSYPLDNPRKEDPPVPVGPYYFETLNNPRPWAFKRNLTKEV
jgi:hypothetical protein